VTLLFPTVNDGFTSQVSEPESSGFLATAEPIMASNNPRTASLHGSPNVRLILLPSRRSADNLIGLLLADSLPHSSLISSQMPGRVQALTIRAEWARKEVCARVNEQRTTDRPADNIYTHHDAWSVSVFKLNIMCFSTRQTCMATKVLSSTFR
jgi:hypothetical protein